MNQLKAANRIYNAFVRVKAFVLRKCPEAATTTISFCRHVRKGLRGAARERAYMHAGHEKNQICVDFEAAKLTDPYLIGIFLHEFGHVFGSPKEAEADRWVFETLGVPLRYRGPKKLEWLDPKLIEEHGI